MSEWQPIEMAPENILVQTKIDDEHGPRNEQSLIRRGRLWWMGNGRMYVYYTPTHWQPLPSPPHPSHDGKEQSHVESATKQGPIFPQLRTGEER